MKRILITGGAGFLGSHLANRLWEKGNHITVLDNFFTGRKSNIGHLSPKENFYVVHHDVCEPFHHAVEEIYHLACPASPVHYQLNPVKTIETCVQGTINALKLAKYTGAKVLIASTSEIYGDPEVHPQVETYWGNVNTLGPRSCYDEGKRCAESLAFAFNKQYNVDVKIVRIFNTYGPQMALNDGRVVTNFISQALTNQPITVYGDGTQTRSFCYVSDLIRGLVSMMKLGQPADPVNLGNPTEVAMNDLFQKIVQMTGSSSQIQYTPLPKDDPKRRKPNIAKAKELLGWEPSVSLDTGLHNTIEYMKGEMNA